MEMNTLKLCEVAVYGETDENNGKHKILIIQV